MDNASGRDARRRPRHVEELADLGDEHIGFLKGNGGVKLVD